MVGQESVRRTASMLTSLSMVLTSKRIVFAHTTFSGMDTFLVNQSQVPVSIQLRGHDIVSAEADFCRLIKNDPESKESKDKILQCIRISPDYFVLEHFGEDLRAYYQADLAVRTGPLLDAILSSVHFLHHRLKYIHGDLQPESFRIYDSRGRFFCKLCHFHNACQDGERFPTVKGKLCITETWTCPELYWASRNNEPIKIDGSFQMDIFNLGLIIELLCRSDQDLPPNVCVINPNSVTRERLFRRENQDQFFESIHFLRNDHWLGDLLRTMLLFDPLQRKDVRRYQELLYQRARSSFDQEKIPGEGNF
jgi:serine/threonine protein kinase